MNELDQASRYQVKSGPPGVIQWLIPALDPRIGFGGWLDTRTLPFPGAPDRTCDTVAELITPTGRWALVIEVQTEPDPDILDRLLEYLARLRRELRHGETRRDKYQVAVAVVNLTGRPQADRLEMVLPGSGTDGLRLQPVMRFLRSEDAGATLEGIAAGRFGRAVLGWIPLMAGGDQPSTIERWKQVAAEEPDSQLRATYGALVLIFAELAGREAQWRAGLEGWNMWQSKMVAEWKAEGRAEGLAEGRTEGRAEGEHAATRSLIARSLRIRFSPQTLPEDLSAAIRNQADMSLLERWFDLAQTVPSLDAFRAAVGLGTANGEAGAGTAGPPSARE